MNFLIESRVCRSSVSAAHVRQNVHHSALETDCQSAEQRGTQEHIIQASFQLACFHSKRALSALPTE